MHPTITGLLENISIILIIPQKGQNILEISIMPVNIELEYQYTILLCLNMNMNVAYKYAINIHPTNISKVTISKASLGMSKQFFR